MLAAPDEVLHFSEDPTITRFVPHVAATAQQPGAYVWAVDAARCPDYWFPRQCPRAMAWVLPSTSEQDRLTLLGPGRTRVHMIEYAWLSRLQTATLYAYRFSANAFTPLGDPPHAMVATCEVSPLAPPSLVDDLLLLHEQAGIELRLTDRLWPWWNAVTRSTLGFSGIRLRNATAYPY